jgi:hypothetical protein
MDRTEEEVVLRITANYVAEVQAGHAPRLADYLARYPQYADAITEFVAYYHAVEADLPEDAVAPRFIVGVPQLSEGSSTALKHAWTRIQESCSPPIYRGGRAPAGQFTSLLTIASKRHLSLSELAVKTSLSQDIIEKLERRMIAVSTLPQELLRRFATLLEQPSDVIAACVGLSNQSQSGISANVGASFARVRVAEAQSSYRIEEQPEWQAQSFREAIEQSGQLSDEQKDMWRDILHREGL